MQGHWRFGSLEEGEHQVEGFTVLAQDIPHKGGRTFGFRVTDRSGASIAYMSDHSPTSVGPGPDGLGEYHPAARALACDVDLLVHDAQHTVIELAGKESFGHSADGYAVGLAAACGVRQLLLFHHDPPRTDDQLDAIVARHRGAAVEVVAAAEGTVFELRGRSG